VENAVSGFHGVICQDLRLLAADLALVVGFLRPPVAFRGVFAVAVFFLATAPRVGFDVEAGFFFAAALLLLGVMSTPCSASALLSWLTFRVSWSTFFV
jgi:hypothetical protein